MPSNIIKFQQSISSEFNAIKDRIKFFIDNAHWGEEGRYKEEILKNYLRKILPNNVGVGTGFVKNYNNELTSQIDILIFKKDHPKLFSEGEFLILMPESVLGIIEVKSKFIHSKKYLKPTDIEKCNNNGRIIGNNKIFNGIFSYSSPLKFGRRKPKILVKQLKNNSGFLNHICFDDSIFMRYWTLGNPNDRYEDKRPCYSFYDLSYRNIFNESESDKSGLAYGYFISNILEMIYNQINPKIVKESNQQYYEFLYPLENTKEEYKILDYDIKIDKK